MLEGRSHAMLQEAGLDIMAELEAEGFYTTRRTLTSPAARRSRDRFGSSGPVDLPTPVELDTLAERWRLLPPNRTCALHLAAGEALPVVFLTLPALTALQEGRGSNPRSVCM